MGKKKFIHQIIGLDSKYRYSYIILIILIAFLDFFFSILFNYGLLSGLILKYIILFIYYFLALTLPKKLPSNFKKFVINNPIFINKNEQKTYEHAFEKNLSPLVEKILFVLINGLFITAIIINSLNQKEIYYYNGMIRVSNLILFIIDCIIFVLGALFVMTPFYYLFTTLMTIRTLGNNVNKIHVDYQILRLDKLNQI